MIKDVPNDKKQELIKNMNNLVSRITNINAMISATVGSVGMLKDLASMLSDFLSAREDKRKKLDDIEQYVIEHNPKRNDESETEYRKRILELMDIEEKRREKAKKQEAKEKMKQEWKERRNNDSSST